MQNELVGLLNELQVCNHNLEKLKHFSFWGKLNLELCYGFITTCKDTAHKNIVITKICKYSKYSVREKSIFISLVLQAICKLMKIHFSALYHHGTCKEQFVLQQNCHAVKI